MLRRKEPGMWKDAGGDQGCTGERAATARPETDVARYVDLIESHLAVTLGDAARVRDAYARLDLLLAANPTLAAPVRLRLASLLRGTRSRAAPALFQLLIESVPALDSPGALLAELLRVRSPQLRARALALIIDGARSAMVPFDLELAVAVATAFEPDPLEDCLDALADLLSRLDDARLPAVHGDPLGRLLEPSVPLPVRLLAARLLDRDEQPAPADRATRVLGARAAHGLAHYLAYTRASHRDLVNLAPGPAPQVRALDSILAAEAILGRERLAAAVAQLGWLRVADEVEAEPVTVLRLDGSFPLVLRPAEAMLAERCATTSASCTGWLVTARGFEDATVEPASADRARIARFRAYSVDHAELLGEILEVAPVTVARCRRIVGLLDRVVSDYLSLFAELDPEAPDVPERYAAIRADLAAWLDGKAGPDVVLPQDVAYRVQAFEDPRSVAGIRTLHGLKRYLHQRGLRHAFRLFGSGGAANRSVDLMLLRDGHAPALVQRIRYIDFEDQDGHDLPLAVRLVRDAYRAYLAHGITDLPRVRALIYGTEVQLYAWFRNHPAFIRMDLSPPRRGGMIDLEYYAVSQHELNQHPDLGVPAVQRILRRLRFHVEMDGTRLHARYDKERAVELSDLVGRAAMLLRLMPRFMDLDWTLASLDLPPGEREVLVESWADFLDRQGVLPPGDGTLPGIADGTLIRRLHDALHGLGIRLPAPAAEPEGSPRPGGVGQVDLDRMVLEPLRAAIERGEVLVLPGGLQPAPRSRFRREHEAARLARLLAGHRRPLREAARIASAIRPIERWLRFEASGTVNGYPVERATLSLRDGDATVVVLRDGVGAGRIAFATRGAVPFRVRREGRGGWERPGEVGYAELTRLLARDNYRAPANDGPAVPPARGDDPAAMLRSPNPRPPAPPLPGDRCVPGIPAAPGRGSGFVRMARPGRHPADFDGAVLAAPAIRPADTPSLARAAGAISTGGGTLSHVGLLALELRKPSLIVEGHWRQDAGADAVLVLTRTELRRRTGRVRGVPVSCWERARQQEVKVREGDLVVVDSDDATLRLLGAGRDALVLHQGLRDLEAASHAIAAANDDAAVISARGSMIRVIHQLDRAVRRMRRPVLAHYAVRELIAAQATPGSGPATLERRRILDVLCQSPFLGRAARAARDGALGDLRDRLRALVRSAGHTIPGLPGPLEVLFLRLAAARLRDGLRGVADLHRIAGSVAPARRIGRATGRATGRVDRLAGERLLELRTALVDEIRSLHVQEHVDPALGFALGSLDVIDRVAPQGDSPATERLLADARRQVGAAADAARARVASRMVVPWADCGLAIAPVVGRKAGGLGEVARVLPDGTTPPWFVVTDAAFRAALASPVTPAPPGEATTLETAIRDFLSRTDLEPARRSAWIRDFWLRARLPADLEAEIVRGYRALAGADAAPPVAVRSSAMEEDTGTATWAGQFDTFLFVAGEAAVLRHVRLAWAGLWSPRALYHRPADAALRDLPGGGVMVQRMVDSRVAGVVTTVDAANGAMRELVVNAGLGLGAGIVSGMVNADEIHVARNDRHGAPLRLRYRVADKRDRLTFDTARGRGTRRTETLFHQRLRPALEYTELEALVAAALTLEATFREPLDVEFAFEGASLRILQARPIPLFRATVMETIERFPLKETAS
jgi:hypothetical protein